MASKTEFQGAFNSLIDSLTNSESRNPFMSTAAREAYTAAVFAAAPLGRDLAWWAAAPAGDARYGPLTTDLNRASGIVSTARSDDALQSAYNDAEAVFDGCEDLHRAPIGTA